MSTAYRGVREGFRMGWMEWWSEALTFRRPMRGASFELVGAMHHVLHSPISLPVPLSLALIPGSCLRFPNGEKVG